MQNRIKNRKCARGDFSDWSWNDAMRAVAICDARNGKTDAEQFAARMELLRENPDLETRPSNKMADVMKKFFELSNETDSDDKWPFPRFDGQPDGEFDDEESSEDSEDEDESDEHDTEGSREEHQDTSDRVCIRKVIKQEQERFK